MKASLSRTLDLFYPLSRLPWQTTTIPFVSSSTAMEPELSLSMQLLMASLWSKSLGLPTFLRLSIIFSYTMELRTTVAFQSICSQCKWLSSLMASLLVALSITWLWTARHILLAFLQFMVGNISGSNEITLSPVLYRWFVDVTQYQFVGHYHWIQRQSTSRPLYSKSGWICVSLAGKLKQSKSECRWRINNQIRVLVITQLNDLII